MRPLLNNKYKIKKNVITNECRMIQNGVPCNRQPHCRGLCSKHHSEFLRHKLMKKYAAKLEYTYFSTTKYRINKKSEPNECHLIENGKPCTRKIHGVKLCSRHWLIMQRHGLLDKYGTLSNKRYRIFSIKKRKKSGICRVKEDNKPCQCKSKIRGLCTKHYLYMMRNDLLNDYALESKK